ncbi:MAG: class I SAM-dependent methyltransferase [Cytophagales bacterium]|nr:MAG: class I SAM-dependent methyltransferase [Cytophagales bacterium]
MNKEQVTWYSEWFNSPFYHILYKNHDFTEAEFFIDHLVDKLALSPNTKIADIACGRGRHSIYLNKKGFEVTGLDLSPNSIDFANLHANPSLKFSVHDMRKVFKKEYFDVVLNLFTSFGYFDEDSDNQKAITAMAENLKPNGYFILDFMNTQKVINSLVYSETKIEQEIVFNITRRIKNNHIIKSIQFEHMDEQYFFEEKVKAITYQDFLNYFQSTALYDINVFGNYQLEPYTPESSTRMIFILRK